MHCSSSMLPVFCEQVTNDKKYWTILHICPMQGTYLDIIPAAARPSLILKLFLLTLLNSA